MVTDLSVSSLHIREFSVVIAARNHNPTILNPDFLVRNEIVSSDWNLAEPPVCVEPYAQVVYTNGISVVSDLGKMVFSQTGNSLTKEVVKVVEMARRYVNAVPHVDYRELGINPKGDVEFKTEEESRQYIMGKLVAGGPWQVYGKAPVRASTTFVFQLEKAKLFVTIQEAKLKQSEGTSSSVVAFAANFHYKLDWIAREDMIKTFSDALGEWQDCWMEYVSLVSDIFKIKEL